MQAQARLAAVADERGKVDTLGGRRPWPATDAAAAAAAVAAAAAAAAAVVAEAAAAATRRVVWWDQVEAGAGWRRRGVAAAGAVEAAEAGLAAVAVEAAACAPPHASFSSVNPNPHPSL